jgi:hypothetical protein
MPASEATPGAHTRRAARRTAVFDRARDDLSRQAADFARASPASARAALGCAGRRAPTRHNLRVTVTPHRVGEAAAVSHCAIRGRRFGAVDARVCAVISRAVVAEGATVVAFAARAPQPLLTGVVRATVLSTTAADHAAGTARAARSVRSGCASVTARAARSVHAECAPACAGATRSVRPERSASCADASRATATASAERAAASAHATGAAASVHATGAAATARAAGSSAAAAPTGSARACRSASSARTQGTGTRSARSGAGSSHAPSGRGARVRAR